MIEFEYWWLLALPLFFALGWLAARVDMNQLLSESSALPAAYFKGLNFLIKEQHDKAIEAFIEAAQSNVESLELHFALGSLFRRRGEVDRAIHLHQNLLERPQLSDLQKSAIMTELAQDFLKAGLYDRAEALFRTLCDVPSYQQPALRALLDIYIREREWLRAIETSQELERLSGVPFHKEIAEFYCELAAANPSEAPQQLAQALQVNRFCIRANVMLGDMAATAGNHSEAIAIWKRIENQKPQYLGLIATRLLESHRRLDQAEAGLSLLKSWAQKYDLPTVLDVVYEATLAQEGAQAAAAMARDELSKRPSMNLLDRLLQALGRDAQHMQQDIPLMQNTVHYFLGSSRSYCCDQCGFKARRYYWQCPGCNGWETFPPEPKEQPLR
ncbi:MAG TPA: lipopolysaccharide assembly protein LapB [Anaerolineae bacterium]|nr:lipopolysaccharide assembly protein LapB [Anaerolineae bacterium]